MVYPDGQYIEDMLGQVPKGELNGREVSTICFHGAGASKG